MKTFGYIVCFSLALNINYIRNGENHIGTSQASEAKRRWKLVYVFYKHCIPDEPPFLLFLSSISKTVKAFNCQLECGQATDSNFTKHSERYFSPLKKYLELVEVVDEILFSRVVKIIPLKYESVLGIRILVIFLSCKIKCGSRKIIKH